MLLKRSLEQDSGTNGRALEIYRSDDYNADVDARDLKRKSASG